MSVVLPDTVPSAAVMVLVPALTALASPFEPAALLTVATACAEEDHITPAVMLCVELSEYVPVAVSCWVRPVARLTDAGVTLIDFSVAAVTVTVVLPDTPLKVAVTVVVPGAAAVTRPAEATAATDALEELQVTCEVISWVD